MSPDGIPCSRGWGTAAQGTGRPGRCSWGSRPLAPGWRSAGGSLSGSRLRSGACGRRSHLRTFSFILSSSQASGHQTRSAAPRDEAGACLPRVAAWERAAGRGGSLAVQGQEGADVRSLTERPRRCHLWFPGSRGAGRVGGPGGGPAAAPRAEAGGVWDRFQEEGGRLEVPKGLRVGPGHCQRF